MSKTRRIHDDLEYVGGIVRRSEGGSPFSIYLLWALMVLVGFSLVDLAPHRVGIFWLVGGPLGGAASAWLGYRHGRRIGQLSREEGFRHLWHWGGMMTAILLAVPLAHVSGAVDWNALSRVILLIIALSYFLAGVHLERPLRWIGALMMAGYAALFFMTHYGWTLVGILVATGLIVSGSLERHRGAPADR
jgi:hypothetical protein